MNYSSHAGIAGRKTYWWKPSLAVAPRIGVLVRGGSFFGVVARKLPPVFDRVGRQLGALRPILHVVD
jgi:hypothetical protein